MMNTGENSAIKNNMISNKTHTKIKPMRNTFTDFNKENRTVCVAGQIAISGTAEFTKKLSSFSGFSNIMVSPYRFTVYVSNEPSFIFSQAHSVFCACSFSVSGFSVLNSFKTLFPLTIKYYKT